MKNQIFYLLGAGASVMQNKQTKKACLPLANDFVDKLKKLRYELNEKGEETSARNTQLILNGLQMNVTDSLNDLINAFLNILSTADTIDAAMRYFYLNDNEEFMHYKKMISIIFYAFENIEQFRDPRYKQFLMTLIKDKNFNLPENIKILSWNYDNQFEHACYEIQDNKENLKSILNNENYVKINGSATFQAVTSDIGNDLTPIRENFNEFIKEPNKIDFAWEEEFDTKFLERIDTIKRFSNSKESIMVVIGYSFPYINHKFDYKIIDAINPTKIYIQNPNIKNHHDYIKSLRERFGYYNNSYEDLIEIIEDCSRFHIPNEMYEVNS